MKTKRKGFTLLELLVVIAIIGTMIAFLVPNLAGSRDKAREAAVKSVMHTVQLALEAYTMENGTYPLGNNITIKALYDNYLCAGAYLGELPKNPFTDKPYVDSDTAGKIIYLYDNTKDKYTLVGHKRDGLSEVLRMSNM